MRTLTFQQACRYTSNETEFLTIGCTPCEEDCTPAGYDNLESGIIECKALINQLRRLHGIEPEGCEFFIMENFHDFGVYYEACIFYLLSTDEDETHTDSEIYAFKCERLPEKWDDEAIKELRNAGYFMPKKQTANVINLHADNLSAKKVK